MMIDNNDYNDDTNDDNIYDKDDDWDNEIRITIIVIAEIKVVKTIVVNKNLDGNENHERNLRYIMVATLNQLKIFSKL